MAAICDYTALELLKHVVRQELLDFHKVYIKAENSNENIVSLWDEQYLCIGRQEIFLVKCPYSPLIPPAYLKTAPAVSLPKVTYRFPFLAIDQIVVPKGDEYGFQIKLNPHEKTLSLAEHYNLYGHPTFDSLIESADERKEIPHMDDQKDDLIHQATNAGDYVQLDAETAILSNREREIIKKKNRVRALLNPYWSSAPLIFTLISMQRLPIIQSLRAAFKVDNVVRDNKLHDVTISNGPKISPFTPVNLVSLARDFNEKMAVKNKYSILGKTMYIRTNYSFLAWENMSVSELDTLRPFATYAPHQQSKELDFAAQSNLNNIFHTDKPELLSFEDIEKRRRFWVHNLVVKVNPYEAQFTASHLKPNRGHSDSMFASQLEFIAHAVAKDHNQSSYREMLLKSKKTDKKSHIKMDDFSFKINSDVYKKAPSLTNDRADYFCYYVHVVTRERQICVMDMPPDAARCQDLVFILVGRKLMPESAKVVNNYDSKFAPDELKDFALPLMHIVDTLSPNDSHPQAYLTEAARCEWEFSREAIARFPLELETLRDALRKAESAIGAINNDIDHKKRFCPPAQRNDILTSPEMLRLVKDLKQKQLDASAAAQALSEFEEGRIEKMSALYERMDTKLRECKALLVSDELSLAIAKQLEEGYRALTFMGNTNYKNINAANLKNKKADNFITSRSLNSAITPDILLMRSEPWNQCDNFTLMRRNYAPLNFTAYDERLIVSKLNALLFDVPGFEWCAKQDWAPREQLRAPEDFTANTSSTMTASNPNSLQYRSQSFYDWGLSFAKCAFNPIREIQFQENEETKDLDDKEKGNRIFKVEHEILQESNPWDCWLLIVKAIHRTFLPTDPLILQSWSDRLAIYLTFVLELGWKSSSSSPVYQLPNLLTRTISTNQMLTNWELTNIVAREKTMDASVRWTSRTIEDEKELNREALFEVLLHPHPEIGEFETSPHWFYQHTPDIYHYTGSVYIKLLENHLVLLKMKDAEAGAIEKLQEQHVAYKKDIARYKAVQTSTTEEELGYDFKNEAPIEPPQIPSPQTHQIHPFLHLNEHLLQRMFDNNYFRWKIFDESKVVEDKTDIFQFENDEDEDRIQIDSDQILCNKRTLEKVPPPTADRSSDPPLLLADLPTAVLERYTTLPELIASILCERNYNQPLIFSVCNWMIRIGKFGDMRMNKVATALQTLVMRGGGELVVLCLRALTTIIADENQNATADFFNSPSDISENPVYVDGGTVFLTHTIGFLFASHSSSALLQATCQFLSVVATSNSFITFIKDTRYHSTGAPLLDDILHVMIKILSPILHGQRHDPKLITSACGLIKRLAFYPDSRFRMWPLRFVETLAKLIHSWKSNFSAMDQALRAVTNLVYKINKVSVVSIMPVGWENRRVYGEDDNIEDRIENPNVVGMFKSIFKNGDSKDEKKVEELTAEEEQTLSLAEQKERKLALKAAAEVELKAKKVKAEQEELRSKMIKPDEVKLLLKALCTILSQSSSRSHRENTLLSIKNLTNQEQDTEDDDYLILNPVIAFLLRKCEFEVILKKLYTGYSAIITDVAKEPLLDVKQGRKPTSELPTESTQAREMDLIRFLMERIDTFKGHYYKVSGIEFNGKS